MLFLRLLMFVVLMGAVTLLLVRLTPQRTGPRSEPRRVPLDPDAIDEEIARLEEQFSDDDRST